MAGERTIKIRITGDARGLERASRQGSRAVLGWRQGMLSAYRSVAAGAAVAAVAGAAVVVGGVKIANWAAKLELMARKAATVFEDQIGRVQAWARANANAMGLTSRELIGLTANFADLLKPMGFSAKTAADMSIKVNSLAGALAEWSGGTHTAAEVSEILSSAMLGERDALKSLGISILDADVKNRLHAKGQDKLTGKALEQAKAIATMELIFEKSTDAQKAFKDGGDTLGRTLTSMKAKAKDFAETLIEKATPAIKAAVKFLGELKKKADEFAAAIFGGEDFASRWQALRDALRPLMDDLAGLKEAVAPLIDDFKRVAGPLIRDGIKDLQLAWNDLREALKDPEVRAGLKSIAVILGTVLLVAALLIIGAFRSMALWARFFVHVFADVAKIIGVLTDRIILGFIGMLRFIKSVVDVAAAIPGPWQKSMKSLSRSLGGAINKAQGLKDAINGIPRARSFRLTTNERSAIASLRRIKVYIAGVRRDAQLGIVVPVRGGGRLTERQHGGPVLGGRDYLVGERGPEILRMGTRSGHVFAADASKRMLETETGAGGGHFEGNLYLDSGTFLGVVRGEIRSVNRGVKRRALAGTA